MTARILVVEGGVPCRGVVRTPGEKSISHRSVLLAALAEGSREGEPAEAGVRAIAAVLGRLTAT